MVRRLMIMAFCLVAAIVLSGGPLPAASEEKQAKEKTADQKQNEKKAKEENKDGSITDGVNRAFEQIGNEAQKIEKNLKGLYERSTSTSGDKKK